MQAAALLRQRGRSVALCDVTLAEDPDALFRDAVERERPRMVAVVEDNFNFLTKMCLLRNRELAFRMAQSAGVPVIVNGSDASDRAAEYLHAGFQTVIVGELERALEDVDRLPKGIWRSTASVTDLDSLPDAAWDLIDVEAYRAAWREAHGYFSLNLVSSRGCPYRCNWCAKPVFGSSYRFRSAERVAQEMLRLKREFKADHVWFADDIFALSPQWTRAFADSVEKLGAALPFKMQSRCDLMTRDTVSALKRAGCAEVWMGAESGSQRILDAMDKGTRVEQIYEAREHLRRHGIRACFFLQFGYPGETLEDIEATLRMVRQSAPDDVGISVSYPLPGTKFYDRVSQELGAKANWNDSDDLDMMFRGAYSTAFYRELAEAVHAEVRGGAPDWARVYAMERVSANPALWTSC
jgi:anaerobic magnesium-protoporphyrin IX monomethyl ester cyclase